MQTLNNYKKNAINLPIATKQVCFLDDLRVKTITMAEYANIKTIEKRIGGKLVVDWTNKSSLPIDD